MSRRYHIRSLQDIADRLTDPATRENFKTDLLIWIGEVEKNSERMARIKSKAEGILGRPGKLRMKAKLIWIDDGEHNVTKSVRVTAAGVPLGAFEE